MSEEPAQVEPPQAGARAPRVACVALVVARARNGVIGRNGALPWRLKDDLKFFKRMTLSKPVLMGRKTWESLPRALPGRANLVLTRNPDFHAEGAETFLDFDSMLARAQALAAESGAEEVMVIGGERLFDLALPRAHRLYLTEVEAEVDGDVWFPHLDEAGWREISSFRHEADTDNEHAFRVRVLERIAPAG